MNLILTILKNTSFLSFDGTSLISHCCTYHNEDSKKVCLIPVVHLGDLEYYQNLDNFIGNRQTIYENMKFIIDKKGEKQIELKNFDDYMEQIIPSTEEFYSKYKILLNNFYKKFLSKDIRKLLKSVKKLVEISDDRIKKMYDMSEKTRFNLQSLPPIQLYWTEIMNLTHQFTALDYQNDINNRKNWIYADLDIGKLMEDVDLDELLKKILTEPSKFQLNEILKEIEIILLSILQTIEFSNLLTISQRRERLATLLMIPISQQQKTIENASQNTFNIRNNLVEKSIGEVLEKNDEVVIFFGALHMIGIEAFLIENGFTYIAEEPFKVFDINDDDD